jgi:hypothetical protein
MNAKVEAMLAAETSTSPSEPAAALRAAIAANPRTAEHHKFAIRDLSVLAYGNGFTLWHYKMGPSAIAVAAEPGFFGDARVMLAPGDLIMITGSGGATIRVVASTSRDTVITATLA